MDAPLLLPNSGGSDHHDEDATDGDSAGSTSGAMATCRSIRRSSSNSSSNRSLATRSVGKLLARSGSSMSISNKSLSAACRRRARQWGQRKNTSSAPSCLSGDSSCTSLLEVNTDLPAASIPNPCPAPSPSLSPTCVAGFDANTSLSFFDAFDSDDACSAIYDRTSFFSSATTTELLVATKDNHLPHIPPELYGDISTYLLPKNEVGNLLLAVSASSSSPSSSCHADRRAVATIIRTTYLRRNYAYLAHSWTKPYAKRQANICEWMAVNADWKDLYTDEEAQNSGIFNLVFGNLMRATEVGLVHICRHLIEERGADINQEEVEPMLAMHRGETSRRRIATVRPIMVAFKLPDDHVLRYYLDEVRDLDVNYFINKQCGLRFVHQIVSLRYAGKAEHLRLLLQSRGNNRGDDQDSLALDVNARVDNGMTCLHLFMGRKTMPNDAVQRLNILLEAGADPSLRDVNGYTPLAIFKKRDGDRLDKAKRREIKMLLRGE